MSFKLVAGSVILVALSISPISGDSQCTCARQYAPVCGSDGVVYPNKCLLECTQSVLRNDLTVTNKGPCEVARLKRSDCACVRNLAPVCGTDGVTYNNICLLRCARQKDSTLEVHQQGRCQELRRSRRGLPYEKRYSLNRRTLCSFE